MSPGTRVRALKACRQVPSGTTSDTGFGQWANCVSGMASCAGNNKRGCTDSCHSNGSMGSPSLPRSRISLFTKQSTASLPEFVGLRASNRCMMSVSRVRVTMRGIKAHKHTSLRIEHRSQRGWPLFRRVTGVSAWPHRLARAKRFAKTHFIGRWRSTA